MSGAYYNEFDPFAAQWLRNLIAAGHIPAGEVDQRSIEDVSPDEIRGFAQAHWFGGIGGWPFALRLAGWPDDREVWTGSCPCQPLSSAGQRKGHADERHLWPTFYRLIAERRPPTVFGEQVSGQLGFEWLAGVRADLEASGYACGAADLPAACVGAPHIRQRLFWMARANGTGPQPGRQAGAAMGHGRPAITACADGDRLGDAESERRRESGCNHICDREADSRRETNWFGDAGKNEPSGPVWIQCSDGKARRAQSGIFPLAHGLPGGGVAIGSAVAEVAPEIAGHIFARVGVLRGAGNAIVPQVAAEFVKAAMECMP